MTNYFTSLYRKWGQNPNKKLLLLLSIGLLHGLLYIFITPPWWHHDETGHFQVAWFIANHNRYPGQEEVDVELQKDLIASLDTYHLFDYINYAPNTDEAIPDWVLAPQNNDPPLYYMLASLPLRLLKNADLLIQNRVLRLQSLIFFLLFLWASWKLTGEVFGENHPLRSMSTAFLALLPGMVNEMTSISNEPLGTLCFALFLLAGVRLLKYGFSWKNSLIFISSALAGYYTRNTIWVSLTVLIIFLLIFIIFDKRTSWQPWVMIILLFTGIFPLLFQWGDARYWYKAETNSIPENLSRQYNQDAPLGKNVLELTNNDTFRQRIPAVYLKPHRDSTLTLGFWAWAPKQVKINSPQVIFYTGEKLIYSPSQKIILDTQPRFYTILITVPENSGRGWIKIRPGSSKKINVPVFFDGFVLAAGNFDESPPQFDDKTASSGSWNGRTFTNLIRNGSAEDAWFRISPSIWNKGLKNFKTYISPLTITALQDWQGSSWYFKSTFISLNETFWGKFGPSTIPMLGSPYIYQLLRVIGIIGLIGFFILFIKKFQNANKRVLLFLGLSIMIIWGQTILRGVSTLDQLTPIIPWTRYALAAILPTAMLLCSGWYFLLKEITKRFIGGQPWIIFIAFMISLDIFSILTMLRFFYLQTEWTYLVLFIALSSSLAAVLILTKSNHENQSDKITLR